MCISKRAVPRKAGSEDDLKQKKKTSKKASFRKKVLSVRKSQGDVALAPKRSESRSSDSKITKEKQSKIIQPEKVEQKSLSKKSDRAKEQQKNEKGSTLINPAPPEPEQKTAKPADVVEVEKPEAKKSVPLLIPPKSKPKSTTPGGSPFGKVAQQKRRNYQLKAGSKDNKDYSGKSLYNERTEFLENAQLTKLMSNADLRAALGGQTTQGGDNDDSCRDTIDEVDSELHDLVFSPLLNPPTKEEQYPINLKTVNDEVPLQAQNSQATEHELREMFSLHDKDMSGFISKDDVICMLMGAEKDDKKDPLFKTNLKFLIQCIKEADKNGDSKITFEEFKEYINKVTS